jgi:hypothetical protein
MTIMVRLEGESDEAYIKALEDECETVSGEVTSLLTFLELELGLDATTVMSGRVREILLKYNFGRNARA